MNILVVGSGGREHAIVWKLRQNNQVDDIYVAPGNAGIAEIANCVSIAADDIDGLVKLAQEKNIDLTIVGPEKPLTMGIVDRFMEAGLRCFGPTMKAAELEGSKVFSKNLMKKYGIPTADYEVFSDVEKAIAYAKTKQPPIVIKADGLAAGKGVLICETKQAIENAIKNMLEDNQFGKAGERIVIEEFLTGQEVSVLAFSDGEHVIPMVSSQDHKRIFDGDQGPNTGGMGAYSPAPMYSEEMAELVLKTIVQPTIAAMKEEGRPFSGILYTGLMLTEDGPKVLEYNVRFGDPEAQPVLMRMESDLVKILLASLEGKLENMIIQWRDEAAVCVVMAAANYPDSPIKGDVIEGLNNMKNVDTKVFHAGTVRDGENIVTAGGRVLGVTALGSDIESAIDKAYAGVKQIHFTGMQYRKDIGEKALKMEG